jgi:hypothetical protein
VRSLRDSVRPTLLRRSPVTRSRAERHAATLEELTAVARDQASTIELLQHALGEERKLSRLHAGRADRSRYEAQIEQLRGVIVALQQAIYRHLPLLRAAEVMDETQRLVDEIANQGDAIADL